ncbi:hypothetical protein MKX01_037645 [Papaver californicum]|nr:hypothetical protein MKX01_037645 [Papaver californicum]
MKMGSDVKVENINRGFLSGSCGLNYDDLDNALSRKISQKCPKNFCFVVVMCSYWPWFDAIYNGCLEAGWREFRSQHEKKVTTLMNEFTLIATDFFSDPILEISTYASPSAFGVDGLITDYPATANTYLRSPCADLDATNLQYTILSPQPGEMLSLAKPDALQPDESPAPSLEPADVVDPPLPPVSHVETTNPAAVGPSENSKSTNIASTRLCLLSLIYIFMVLY